MKRKLIAILALLLVVGFVFQAAAFEDEDDFAPRRRFRRRSFLQKRTFSVGFIGAVKLKTDFLDENDDVVSSVEEDKKAYFGFSARLFPFWGGKLGIGLDAIALDWGEYDVGFDTISYSIWQVDIDVLLRFKIGRRLLVNGGLGWSAEAYTWESDSGATDTIWGAGGFNIKLGAEYFIARYWSITFDYKWTTVENENPEEGTVEKRRTHSVQAGIHYWF